jgi:DNA-binding MarR family transcriptional regulator
MKTLKSLEKTQNIFKGLASSKRLLILDTLAESGGLSLSEISEFLHLNLKTAAEHCRRLELSGLIAKRKKGREVIHTLTYLGRGMLTIARRTKDLIEKN